jgi:methyl-accepting chemotaxis protein
MNGFHGMHGTYDAFLVGLSIVIAVLASFTALTLAGRVKEAVGRARMVWLVGAATALGGGIWSMHFVAMLAFSLQMPIQYNVALTAISLVAAIVVTALALYTVTRWSGLRSLGIAGFFAGIGVATMHYMGMAAMEMNATVSYDPLIFGASIVIAVVAATAALWLALNLQAVWHKVAAALVMGAAICGMHYTGMAAAIFTPADGPPLAASSISAYGLAMGIGGATIAIFALGIMAALVDRRFTGQLRRELEERVKVELELRQSELELRQSELQLRQSHEGLQAASGKLTSIVREASVGVEALKTATEQLSAGAADLSSRTDTQVSSLSEMAAAIRQLTVTAQNTADNAERANRLAAGAHDAAAGGGEVAMAAVDAMKRIESSSGQIASIVGLIQEIAFQTNLLALNAAVEAARAGDSGRGFAVVAAEVRALAQRASAASKDIKVLIADSDTQVREGVQLVNKAGSTLGDIVAAVKSVTAIVAEIATASREQSAGVQLVDESVTQMETVTQKNAALVEETTATLAAVDQKVAGLMSVVDMATMGSDPQDVAADDPVSPPSEQPQASAA